MHMLAGSSAGNATAIAKSYVFCMVLSSAAFAGVSDDYPILKVIDHAYQLECVTFCREQDFLMH